MFFIKQFFAECADVLRRLDPGEIAEVIQLLDGARAKGGRVFVLGVGGSAAAASHFVNDLRKLTGIEAYAPTDNVSELTARINDEGWDSCFAAWLTGSRIHSGDLVFVFSVGGGDETRHISPNLAQAIDLARARGARIAGIVGRDGGYTRRAADASILIPVVSNEHVTPLTESFHALVGHLLVSHPKLQRTAAKWESAVGPDEINPDSPT